jgi:hypothetical protein
MTTKYNKWPSNITNGRQIDEMDTTYSNIVRCKALQNLPKSGFLVCFQTIWHPCYTDPSQGCQKNSFRLKKIQFFSIESRVRVETFPVCSRLDCFYAMGEKLG